ncbi:MAG: hypothetical protein AB9834_11165 [Lentimicrobium sp.]
MKKFIIKTSHFLILFFVCAELISRLIIDPLYFYSINTYNLKLNKISLKDVYNQKNTEHVDYLFIGSSRVPATINPSVIMHENPKINAVVAGRGYMTEGIHYQALENKILEFPDYLDGANIFIEYPGSDIYTSSFQDNKLRVYEPIVSNDKAMPQLLLPHLNCNSLMSFLKESKNSNSVKFEMVLLFFISSYRTIPFIKEKFERLGDHLFFNKTKQQLVSNGGIRNDNFEKAKKRAIDVAAIELKEIQNRPVLSFHELDKSSLAYMNDLINKNGGTLYLFKMPLSSVQEAVYSSAKAMQNKRIFERWVLSKGITILYNENFHFQDTDFPDTWHLSENRRDEFTYLLFNEIKKHKHAIQAHK